MTMFESGMEYEWYLLTALSLWGLDDVQDAEKKQLIPVMSL